jgi:subtilisin
MAEKRSDIRKFIVVPVIGKTSKHFTEIDLFKFDRADGKFLNTREVLREHLRSRKDRIREKFARIRRRIGDIEISIIKESSPDGAKLIETSELGVRELLKKYGNMRFLEVEEYTTMRNRSLEIRDVVTATLDAALSKSFDITVSDSGGAAVAGASVIAFTNFRTKAGAVGVTDSTGKAMVRIRKNASIQKLIVRGPSGFWSKVADATGLVNSGDRLAVSLTKLSEAGKTSFHLSSIGNANIPVTAGTGVKVAVIDTGVDAAHPALSSVTGGANLAMSPENGEQADDWAPSRSEPHHGTHVAGIICGKPNQATGLRGVAPGVELRSYRVVPHDSQIALNIDIGEAIDLAVADGCDIINISMGGEQGSDTFVEEAIGRALSAGVFVVCAAGNNNSRLAYPASLVRSIAVNAYGLVSGFPADSGESLEIPADQAPGKDLFRANFAPQDGALSMMDFGGCGVGIVSTLAGGGYGPMSGSSMAAPYVSGFAAHVLADMPANLRNSRTENRCAAILSGLSATCTGGLDDPSCIGNGIPGQ